MSLSKAKKPVFLTTAILIIAIGSLTVHISQNNLQLDLIIPITATLVVLGLLSVTPLFPLKKQWLIIPLIFIIITPLALNGFIFSTNHLGISDWDQYFTLHHYLRRTITEFNQFPLWNPFMCGGTAGLADPEFSVLTPTFLLEIIFGVPLGLRFSILLSTIIGSLGIVALAKRIGLSPTASVLAALVVFFGSVNILEIVEGHVNIFAAMWIPWIFWSWYSAYNTKNSKLSNNTKNNERVARLGGAPTSLPRRQAGACSPETRRGAKPSGGGKWRDRTRSLTIPWPIICAIFLALTFYQGGIYLLFYTASAFLVLILLSKHPLNAFKITLYAGLVALGLAAFKLIPALFWLKQFPDQAYASSTYTLSWLYEILLGRHLHGAEIIPNQGSGWHEYGAYIGPLALALSIFSLIKINRSRLIRILVICALLALVISSSGPFLKPFFDTFPFIPRSNISRLILFAIIPISLLSGAGLDLIGSLSSRLKPLLPILVSLVAFDLISLTFLLSQQAFVLPFDTSSLKPAPYPIAFTPRDFKIRHNEHDYTRTYTAALAGYGTTAQCTVLGPTPAVIIIESEYDSSAATVDPKAGSVEIQSWSPNSVSIQATLDKNASLTLNTNYARGWTVNNQPAKNIKNLVGTNLPPGQHTLNFKYRPPGLIAGFTVSVITLATIILYLARVTTKCLKSEHKSPDPAPSSSSR
jgi:hypothetical protein